jgi:selenide, water dikinase
LRCKKQRLFQEAFVSDTLIEMMKNLVLIGGGHSHAIALRCWGINPIPDVRLILISDTSQAPYSGMLPGHLGGIYSFDECHINLKRLAKLANAELILDRAIELDLSNKRVLCDRHTPIDFDYLSIDIGSTPATNNIPGVKEYAIAAKPIPHFLSAWKHFIQSIERDNRSRSIGIVGGGAGGVELALTLQVQLQKILVKTEIHLFHRQQELMNGYPPMVRKKFEQLAIDRGIHLHLNESVIKIEACAPSNENRQVVKCQSGLNISCDRIIWVTQAAAATWIQASGLATDDRGFILIDEYLRSISHADIFATGDIATQIDKPCPKAGVFAVRQGGILADNIHNAIANKPLKSFHPQQKYLSLIGIGNSQAVAIWGNLYLGKSRLFWIWKDWIDRRFMAQFNIYPQTKRVNNK